MAQPTVDISAADAPSVETPAADIVSMDTTKAVELRQRMEAAADELDWDAQALTAPLAEASALLGDAVPDVPRGVRHVADELRSSALDLDERTRMVLAGGPEMNEGLAALERIRDHFTMIESRGDDRGADGILSRRDLQWARHSADETTAAAAAWLLDHDRFFDQVETAKHNDDYLTQPYEGQFTFDPEDRDGHMSLDDIDAFLDKTAAFSTLLPHFATLDDVHGGGIDGIISRDDLETFLRDYDLTDEVSGAVRTALDDRAYHVAAGGVGLGAVLDVVSFVPVIGDLVDGARAIYYAIHGDYATAALFALGLVPLPGLSSSGIRGAFKVVEAVADTARRSGGKAAVKDARQRVAKVTAANFLAHESTRLIGGAGGRPDLDESIEYALEDVFGDTFERSFGQRLDPRLRRAVGNRIEGTLKGRVDSDTAEFMSGVNRVIARRMAEHKAYDVAVKSMKLP